MFHPWVGKGKGKGIRRRENLPSVMLQPTEGTRAGKGKAGIRRKEPMEGTRAGKGKEGIRRNEPMEVTRAGKGKAGIRRKENLQLMNQVNLQVYEASFQAMPRPSPHLMNQVNLQQVYQASFQPMQRQGRRAGNPGIR